MLEGEFGLFSLAYGEARGSLRVCILIITYYWQFVKSVL